VQGIRPTLAELKADRDAVANGTRSP
jgi:hypothetical protein